MGDILAKNNRHLFLEEKDNTYNSFISNINHAAENIDTIKTFNDNVNNGTMQHLLEAFTTSLDAQGNAWEVRLTQVGESILATTSAFNYSTVVTVSSDIPANGTLILPSPVRYKVGTHMLMVSWNGTVCYAGEQYDEVGAYGTWATSITLKQPAKVGDKIQLRLVALTDQSSFVDITEAAINASKFTASDSDTERYLSEFLGDIVNVKNFGAVGNGVNNDTTAFQSAVATGKAVFIPEGIYKLTTDITGNFCSTGNSTFIGGTINGSTILRGTAQKNSDIINVKDFGAKGDGATDDTSAWNAAVIAANGKKIYVPEGSYKITDEVADADFFSFDDISFTSLHVPVNNPNYAGNIARKTISFTADFKFPDYDSLLGTASYIYPQAATAFEKNGVKYLFVLTGRAQSQTTEEGTTRIVLVYNYKTQEYLGYYLLPDTRVTEGIVVKTESDIDYIYSASTSNLLVKFAFSLNDFGQTLTSTQVKNSNDENISAYWFISYSNGVWAIDCASNRVSGFTSRTLMLYDENFDIISQFDIQKYQQDIWEGYDNEYSSSWTIPRTQGIVLGPDGVYFLKGGGTNEADTNTPLTDLGVEHYSLRGELVRSSICDHTKFVSKINSHLGLSESNTHSECESGFFDKNGKCFWFGVFGGMTGKIVVLEEFSSDSASIDFTDCLSTKTGNAIYKCNVPVYPRGADSKYYNPWTGQKINDLGDFILFCAKYGIDSISINSNSDFSSVIGTVDLCSSGDNKYKAKIERYSKTVYFVTVISNTTAYQELFVVNLNNDISAVSNVDRQYTFIANTVRQRTTNSGINILGGTDLTNGGRVTLYGKNASGAAGYAELRGCTAQGTSSHLVVTPSKSYISGTDFCPETDDTTSLGVSEKRWKEVFASTATINTSDERLKESVAEPSEQVMKAWGKVRLVIFQFKAAVKKKGESARLHMGVIAQQVNEAFASEGLDASRYGLFCYDEWEAQAELCDENGDILQPALKAGNIYSIRYEEALVLECAYQRWLGEQRDAKIEALMQRISALENNQ